MIMKGYGPILAGALIMALMLLTAPGSAAPFAYVANSNSQTVSVIDTASNTVISTILVGMDPTAIALNPKGTRAYVLNHDSNSISVINTTTNTVISVYANFFFPHGIAVNPAGTQVYVGNRPDGLHEAISVINTTTGAVETTIPYLAVTDSIAFNPAGTYAYVTSGYDNTVSVIDTSSNTFITTIPVGTGPGAIAVDPDGTRIYVANRGGNTVSVINTTTNTVRWAITMFDAPSGIAFYPRHNRAFVTNYAGNSVSEIDTNLDWSGGAPFPVGAGPSSIALNPENTYAYVTNEGGNSVSVINTTYQTILTTIPVGSMPDAIVITQFPGVTGISPASGAFAGGTPVTITGTDFTGATAVTFGGTPATTYTVVSRTRITATAPAGAGTVHVMVTTAGGTSIPSPSDQYTYQPTTVTGITPSTGQNTSAISITDISGTNFVSGVSVNLNRTGFATIPGTGVSVVSPTRITCMFNLTNREAGQYNVLVTNSDGQTGMLVNGFEVTSPQVAAFSGTPTSGTAPLVVTFADESTCSATGWNWSFGDGTFSDLQNPLHTYASIGSYTVSLNATNATPAGNYLTKSGYITVSPVPVTTTTTTSVPTTSPFSGSGGDDGPASGPGGQHALLEGPSGTVSVNVGGNTPVSGVVVTGTGIHDTIVTATEISGPGQNVQSPSGTVYLYLDISPARYGTITGAVITFSIPQSWMTENHLTPQDIVLYHNVGTGWQALPITVVKTENGQVFFSAISPGFSRFAITGQAHATVTLVTTVSAHGQTFDNAVKSPGAESAVPAAPGPIARETSAVPASAAPETGFPFITAALVAVCGVGLIGGGLLVRRWWIRRQNPALFREYD